jgi:hypothetical protein
MEREDYFFIKRFLLGLIPFVILLFSISLGYADWTPVIPPDLGTNWGLQGIHLHSATNGWAVGTDETNKRGVTLQFHDHIWEAVAVPEVSSDWELHSVFSISTGQGWAVGFDRAGKRGVLLKFTNTSTDVTAGSWTVVIPPDISSNWALYGVQFTSATEGWAVGADYSNQRGVLLHYLNGLWTNVIPPDVSPNWGLYGAYFISGTAGWAVGVDLTNTRGALLQYRRDKKTYENIWSVVTPSQVDSDWELNHVHSLSSTDGWAVGTDHADKRAALLHWDGSTWASIIPPEVSSDWELTGVQFTSYNNGWAVGIDYANGTGVLLQAEKGSWTVVTPPTVSSDWELNGVRFIGANDGWAVGFDRANQRGVLLRYSAPTTKETVSAPPLPAGPTNGAPGIVYTYAAGGSSSNLDHSIQYFFDWGDGTNSGWLPVNTLSASKSWVSPGNYIVTAQARCSVDTSVVSKWSSGLSVNISSSSATILLSSPGDETHFDSCSLYSLPTFAWDVTGSFSNYEIQFSKTENFSSIAAKGSTSSTTFPMQSKIWSKVLLIPGMTGGSVFWRVVGTGTNKTTVTSGVFSIIIDPAQAVGNPGIVNTSKSSLPTLSWANNCNIKFRVWFGNNENFSKKTALSFNIKNPNDNGGVFGKSLTQGQWTSARSLVGNVSGSTIFWYVESWDGANRNKKTEPMSFMLTN